MTVSSTSGVAPLAPLPEGTTTRLGYSPPAPHRYLMVYQAGDKVAWYDGITHLVGANRRGFETLLAQIAEPLGLALADLPHSAREADELTTLLLELGANIGMDTTALGSATRPATYVLLCDLLEELIYLTPFTETQAFVRAAALNVPPPLSSFLN